VILAAFPGIVRELLVNEKLVKPGNFSATVNFLGSRIRKVGLGVGSGTHASPASSDAQSELRQQLASTFGRFTVDH